MLVVVTNIFLLFPCSFIYTSKLRFQILIFNLPSANAFNLEQFENLVFDTELRMFINPFPNDKILDRTKLKAFADDKLNITKMTISSFDKVENTGGKGENAGNQSCHLKGHQKSGLCGKELTLSQTTNLRVFQTERVCRRQFQI